MVVKHYTFRTFKVLHEIIYNIQYTICIKKHYMYYTKHHVFVQHNINFKQHIIYVKQYITIYVICMKYFILYKYNLLHPSWRPPTPTNGIQEQSRRESRACSPPNVWCESALESLSSHPIGSYLCRRHVTTEGTCAGDSGSSAPGEPAKVLQQSGQQPPGLGPEARLPCDQGASPCDASCEYFNVKN